MAIARHSPEKLYARNRSLLKMSDEDLEHFARTSRKGLPEQVGKDVPLAELMRSHGRKKRKK